MRNYLSLVERILNKGFITDNGKVKNLTNETLVFNLKQGFPTITTNSIDVKEVIEELLWMIKGSTNIQDLNDVDVHSWDALAVTPEHIKQCVKMFNDIPADDLEAIEKELIDQLTGEIGPMHGHNWRNAPSNTMTAFVPGRELKDIPEHKLKQYKEAYEDFKANNPRDTTVSWDTFSSALYRQTRDQLNELILSIKENPFAGTHVIVSTIPGLSPYRNLSPQINVLAGNGAFTVTDVMFQCTVLPPPFINGKNRLSLKVHQSRVDVLKELPYVITKYALLTYMLAHVLDMDVYEFIWYGGVSYFETKNESLVREQLNRQSKILPKLKLNENVKTIYDFTNKDISLTQHSSYPKINYMD